MTPPLISELPGLICEMYFFIYFQPLQKADLAVDLPLDENDSEQSRNNELCSSSYMMDILDELRKTLNNLDLKWNNHNIGDSELVKNFDPRRKKLQTQQQSNMAQIPDRDLSGMIEQIDQGTYFNF